MVKILDIFTDASVKQFESKDDRNYYCSCPSAIAVDRNLNTIIDRTQYIRYDSSNNDGEINAIENGLMLANKYKDEYEYINLFSDSGICVNGLRNWMNKWINNSNNGVLYNDAGYEVKNQDCFKNIINYVNDNNIKFALLHVKGHVVLSNPKSIQNASIVFYNSNHLRVSDEFIRYISYYNNTIDQLSTEYLTTNIISKTINNRLERIRTVDTSREKYDKFLKLIRREKK